MADDIKVSNFPDSGSQARVAYDLMKYLVNSGVRSEDEAAEGKRKFYLDLYAECLRTTGGYPNRGK